MAAEGLKGKQLAFIKGNNVQQMLSAMMQEVILAQPDDPISFLQELLTAKDARAEEEQVRLLKEIHGAVSAHAGGAQVRLLPFACLCSHPLEIFCLSAF